LRTNCSNSRPGGDGKMKFGPPYHPLWKGFGFVKSIWALRVFETHTQERLYICLSETHTEERLYMSLWNTYTRTSVLLYVFHRDIYKRSCVGFSEGHIQALLCMCCRETYTVFIDI
jgi:hypothetical protein